MGWLADLVSALSCCTKCWAYEWNVAWLVVYRPDNGVVPVSAWEASNGE